MSVIDAGSGDPSIGLEREREVIAAMRGVGMRLTNLTDGGDGTPGLILSSEARSKISAAHRGRKHSPEHVSNQAASLRGKRHSEKRRAAMRTAISKKSAWGPPRRISDQEIADIRATYTGREGEVAALVRATGWSNPTILRALDTALWTIPDAIVGCPILIDVHDRSAAKSNARITAEDVRDIRLRYDSGERVADIARSVGLGWSQVSRIVRRESWADVA